MLQQRRRARPGPRDTVAPAAPPSPLVVDALFCDLEAVGRLRPRNRAVIDAFAASPAIEQLATFSAPVRRRALAQLPHGMPSAKSWLAVCRLSPAGGDALTRRWRPGLPTSR
jgi:hypothetical protein